MKRKKRKLGGQNPISYLGVEPLSTTSISRVNREPTSSDFKNIKVGDLWIDESTGNMWIYVGVVSGVRTWKQLGTIDFGTNEIITDNFGPSVPDAGIILFRGFPILDTNASGNTANTSLGNGTDGQVVISGIDTGAWESITSTGGSVTITTGPNSINLEVPGVAAISSFVADTGSTAPVANVITFTGGTNLVTSASGNTVTIDLDTNISLSGTLTLSSQPAGVLQTDSSGVVTSSNGTDGQVLIGGGTAPAWKNITSTDGTMTVTNGPNSINLESSGGFGAESSFLMVQQSNTTRFILNTAAYYLGEAVVLNTIFDDGSNTFPGDAAGSAATFTAPDTGKYILNCSITIQGGSLAWYPAEIEVSIETSNRKYTRTFNVTQSAFTLPNKESCCMSVCADMGAGDTAKYRIYSPSPSASRRVSWLIVGTPTYFSTWASGYRIA